jgi:hypothetical protein
MPVLHRDKSPWSVEPIDENSMVVLMMPQETKKGVVPVGARGVVHDAMPDVSSYLVEFSKPFPCVIQVPGTAVRRG